MLDLQLSLYSPLCYNNRALLQCLHTTSAILAGAHSYSVVSFKCKGKISCHDLIPSPHSYLIHVPIFPVTIIKLDKETILREPDVLLEESLG